LQEYLPSKILQSGVDENDKYPMLKGKNSVNQTLIYLCKQYSCKTPVTSIEDLLKQIIE
jgi:uncharacterized protein YyaL (SSP411 family)